MFDFVHLFRHSLISTGIGRHSFVMTRALRKYETVALMKAVAYRLAHILVPLVLIVMVLYGVGGRDVWHQLRDIEVGYMLAAICVCSLQILLSAMRWRMTAFFLGASITCRRAVSEYYLSSFINMTVPGGVMGDAARVVRARSTAGLETAAQAVIIERFAGQVALGAVLLFGLLISGRPVLQASALIGFGIIAVLLVFLRATGGVRIGRWVPAFLKRFVLAIGKSWSLKHGLFRQGLLSLTIVIVNLFAFALAARAVGAEIGVQAILYAVPLILLAMLIPFSVGGWGFREGAAAAIFPLIGETAALGVSASVAFGAVILLASLPGAFVMIFSASQTARRAGPAAVHERPAD